MLGEQRSAVWSSVVHCGMPCCTLSVHLRGSGLCPEVSPHSHCFSRVVMRGCVPLPAGDGLGVFVPRSRVCVGDYARVVLCGVRRCARHTNVGDVSALFYCKGDDPAHTACVSRSLSQAWYAAVYSVGRTLCLCGGDMSHCIFVGGALHTT